ncbi:MAG: hypothetical protein DI626_09640 [Micavibrio aeruginosavorus]|uniref:ABC transporter domain-containing protein n=1 Tax=Micavibrio aeruginosavorus TaxID=349221 RepID=A0A2W4ZKK3_9BACT|nr:MAG: hypothetical protein DI626_09640 [Micavibrio aeruginosavorus]
MGTHYHAKMDAIGSAEKLVNLLDMEKKIDAGEKDFHADKIEIEFRNVSFSYGADVPILKNISFKVLSGEKIALVGPSGGGKSTIISLLLGFIRPQEGEIRVNGQPLGETDLDQWRAHLSWLGQRTHLFQGSIEENIKMARENASADEIRNVMTLCRISDLADKIIDERGTGISGGQQQRVGLARAMIRQSSLLLLDEPTAHLDAETEEVIHNAVLKCNKTATVLFAAHRQATLSAADRILYVEGAHVTERGLA